MENLPRPIVIPTDFTVVAQYAIESAVPIAKLSNTGIMLLHIVEKSSEIPKAIVKIEQEAQNVALKHGVQVQGLVRDGSLFKTIRETASKHDATLIIMGTHGIKGMQKLVGSRALKVIIKSKIPFIVVQDAPRKQTIDRIVFPIDHKRECREKIGWAYFVAKLFGSKIQIITAQSKVLFWTDKKLQKSVKTNLLFTEKFLKTKNINYEVVTAKGEKSFAKEAMRYAERIDADLVLITTTKHVSWADYLLGIVDEGIITNDANIPIMCINPRTTNIGGFSTSGG